MSTLIQRLRRRKNPATRERIKSRITRDFEFDYMGSAEFEFGAVYQARMRMQSKVKKNTMAKKVTVKVSGQEYTAWFVCCADEPIWTMMEENAAKLMEGHLQDPFPRTPRTQEITYLFDAYRERNNGLRGGDKDRVTGWWDIGDADPWLLFREKSNATQWIKCLWGDRAEGDLTTST